MAGEVHDGLNIVAGYVYLDPELIGPAVDEGTLGPGSGWTDSARRDARCVVWPRALERVRS